MANNIDAQNSGIPQGFTEETWNRLTPEQKQAYLKGQSTPFGTDQPAMQQEGMAKSMLKSAGRMAMFGFIFSFVTSIVSRIVSSIFRSD
jgi:hypothetical protein